MHELAATARAQLTVARQAAARRRERGLRATRRGRAAALVAQRFGVSEKTIKKAIALLDAAEASPHRFAWLLIAADAHSIEHAYRKLRELLSVNPGGRSE